MGQGWPDPGSVVVVAGEAVSAGSGPESVGENETRQVLSLAGSVAPADGFQAGVS